MINGKFINTASFTSKIDGEETYYGFLEHMRIEREDFPFNIKTGRMFKNQPISFRVSSWGYYETAKGDWRIYVAYRFNPMKHVVQYSWRVNDIGEADGKPDKNEWIGG